MSSLIQFEKHVIYGLTAIC